EGLTTDPARMQANLDTTKGLIFADAAASRLAGLLGREVAHTVVEDAADAVRRTGKSLRDALQEHTGLAPGAPADVDLAFGLDPAVEAAGRFGDRAVAEADKVRDLLSSLQTRW